MPKWELFSLSAPGVRVSVMIGLRVRIRIKVWTSFHGCSFDCGVYKVYPLS
jgi:hypothetical protein